LALVGDARCTLQELRDVANYEIESKYHAKIQQLRSDWEKEVGRINSIPSSVPVRQAEVIELLNQFTADNDILVCAAGSLPGDLHKLWRTSVPGGYHMEYGYSCMGYEIAGGLGVKLAHPKREVYVLVGDGSYLMMAQEIVTSIQEGHKLNIILLDNHGFSSIGGLSRSCGNEGMGTEYRYRTNGSYGGNTISVDFEANAASLGAWTIRARSAVEFQSALADGRKQSRTAVIVIETAYDQRVSGYESWWDVPIAEVSEREAVQSARKRYEEARKKERYFL
jgi:3D-(3,5/4)-trihydroxycyclohexane-1,2-dione acylhydrolase (decyclizing)